MKKVLHLITLTVMLVFMFSVGVMAEETRVYTTRFVYNPNGGIGEEFSNTTKSNATSYTLEKNPFTRTGYTFVAWNTKPDGTGKTYKANTSGTSLICTTKNKRVVLYAIWRKNVLTVKYSANGGTGTMAYQKIEYGSDATLSPNAYTRTGYVFSHWNVTAVNDGTKYANCANITSLVNSITKNTTLVLYAQWRLDTPAINSVSMTDATTIVAKYASNSNATGYQVAFSTSSAFDSASTKIISAKAGSTYAKFTDAKPGKKYYVRMRNYVKNPTSGVKIFSKYSKVVTIIVPEVPTIENTDYFYAIECDVKLTGTGEGYHAKLVMGTETAAVSYGLQYDKYAASPYTKKTAMLIENVKKSSQKYTRPGNKIVELGKKYHLMMVMDEKGNGEVYLDYVKLGTFSNTELANQPITLRIEGACRVDGDSINAEFSNIKLKGNKTYNPTQSWGFVFHDTSYNGTYAKCSKNSNANGKPIIYDDTVINIAGTISLPAGKNWDDPGAYDHVSGVCQFFQR